MPAYIGSNSTRVTQNLVVSGAHAPRYSHGSRFDLPSSLVAHLMNDYQSARRQPKFVRPPLNVAVDTYRHGAKIADRRVPPGYRQTHTV